MACSLILIEIAGRDPAIGPHQLVAPAAQQTTDRLPNAAPQEAKDTPLLGPRPQKQEGRPAKTNGKVLTSGRDRVVHPDPAQVAIETRRRPLTAPETVGQRPAWQGTPTHRRRHDMAIEEGQRLGQTRRPPIAFASLLVVRPPLNGRLRMATA